MRRLRRSREPGRGGRMELGWPALAEGKPPMLLGGWKGAPRAREPAREPWMEALRFQGIWEEWSSRAGGAWRPISMFCGGGQGSR